jgi:phytoene dehydrogenase-like protein
VKQPDYDVVIIGAGMGGMATSALLTHEGYKTLLVERLPLIGGRCSSIVYKGCNLSTGALWVLEGIIASVWTKVGAPYKLVYPKPQYHYKIRDEIYEMPEKGGLKTMLTYAGGEAVAEKIMNAIKRGLTWNPPPNSVTLRDWLLQFTNNETVLGVFQPMVTMSVGINIDELPVGEYFQFIKEITNLRLYGYAPDGLLAMMESLADVIKAKGSDIWTNSPAKQVLVDDGVVRGVVVEKDGRDEIEIPADIVISDIGPKATVALAGNGNFDPAYLKQMNETLRSGAQIAIWAISDRPLLPYPGTLFITESRRTFSYCPSTNVCPEFAPPGKHLLNIGGYFSPTTPPYNPEKEIDLIMQDSKEIVPGFDKDAEILHIGTFHGDWPLSRSWAGYNFPQKTSVENLYNVGDGVKPPGCWGTHGAVHSAMAVVEDVKRRFKAKGA